MPFLPIALPTSFSLPNWFSTYLGFQPFCFLCSCFPANSLWAFLSSFFTLFSYISFLFFYVFTSSSSCMPSVCLCVFLLLLFKLHLCSIFVSVCSFFFSCFIHVLILFVFSSFQLVCFTLSFSFCFLLHPLPFSSEAQDVKKVLIIPERKKKNWRWNCWGVQRPPLRSKTNIDWTFFETFTVPNNRPRMYDVLSRRFVLPKLGTFNIYLRHF
jgi:hypothetical protein